MNFLKLRYEEIAQILFDRTFAELAKQLQEAGRKEPTQQELKDVLDIALEKSHTLLCLQDGKPFISVIEIKYKQAPNGIQRLAYDYRNPQPPDPKELELRYQIAPPEVIENYFDQITMQQADDQTR